MLSSMSFLWSTSKKRKFESDAMSKRQILPRPSREDEEPLPPPFPTGDVNIDGSKGEGGGQVIRNAVALSSVRMRSVTINNIRAGRPNPGLQSQHLTSVKLVAQINSSTLEGAEPCSEQVHMDRPNSLCADHELPLHATVTTAGATALVLQAALPPALRHLPGVDLEKKEQTLVINGGTNAMHAPTSDYVERVLAPNLRHFGIDIMYFVTRHGFYPKGGGQCIVGISKTNCLQERICQEAAAQTPKYFLRPCDLRKRGDIIAIEGNVIVAGSENIRCQLAEHTRRAAVRAIKIFLRGKQGYPSVTQDNITIQRISPSEAEGKCLAITLTALTESHSVIGSSAIMSEKGGRKNRNKSRQDIERILQGSASSIGTEAAEKLCSALETGAAVDANMADQLCVFMGMAKGTSKVLIPKPSSHLNTALDVCHEFNINIRVEEGDGGNNCMLVCDGMGMELR